MSRNSDKKIEKKLQKILNDDRLKNLQEYKKQIEKSIFIDKDSKFNRVDLDGVNVKIYRRLRELGWIK